MKVAPDQYSSRFRAWSLLLLMGVLYAMSFVDRGVLALLIHPLKQDLKLTDLQVGLLYGASFAIFYSFLGIPVARIADSQDRRLMIIGGVALWGLCTVGSGFAASFLALNLLRGGLAIGEAALTPAAHSMIGDLFPPARRSIAASVFQAIGFLGTGGGVIAVGLLISHLNTAIAHGQIVTSLKVWQLVFICVGVPTLILGGVFAIFAREPARRIAIAGEPGASNRELLAYLKQNKRLFIGLFVGAGLVHAISGGFLAFGPEFLRRTYEWDIKQSATALGLITLATVTLSTLTAPLISRLLHRLGRRDAVVLVAMVGGGVGGVLSTLAYFQQNPTTFLVLQALAIFLASGGGNNILFSLQDIAPARLKGTLVALLIASTNLFQSGVGPVLTAFISDSLSPKGDKLYLALALASALSAVPALALLAWSRGALLKSPHWEGSQRRRGEFAHATPPLEVEL
jgi:MFS family permease